MSGQVRKQLVTVLSAVVGGGIAGAFTAAMDPVKYHFPEDFASGKLWKYFAMGAALTLGGIILHSPMGQKVLAGVKSSQEQLKETQKELEDTKAELKASVQQKDKP